MGLAGRKFETVVRLKLPNDSPRSGFQGIGQFWRATIPALVKKRTPRSTKTLLSICMPSEAGLGRIEWLVLLEKSCRRFGVETLLFFFEDFIRQCVIHDFGCRDRSRNELRRVSLIVDILQLLDWNLSVGS